MVPEGEVRGGKEHVQGGRVNEGEEGRTGKREGDGIKPLEDGNVP